MNGNTILTRLATFAPSSLDKAKNTVQAVLSSAGADVSRHDGRGSYIERLVDRI